MEASKLPAPKVSLPQSFFELVTFVAGSGPTSTSHRREIPLLTVQICGLKCDLLRFRTSEKLGG